MGPLLVKDTSTTSALSIKENEKPTSTDLTLAGSLLLLVVTCGVTHHHVKMCHTSGNAAGVPTQCIFAGDFGELVRDPDTGLFLESAISILAMLACMGCCAHYTGQVRWCPGWNLARCAYFQATSIVTGCLAGLVGIGGGLIFSPFFLLMGMDPSIAVGTSSTCVLFTSTSTTIQYVLTGRVFLLLALVYGIVALVGSFIGTSLVHFIRQQYPERKSYITFIVVGTVLVSFVLVLAKLITITPEAVVTAANATVAS